MATFRTTTHVAFKTRYLRPTNKRGARIKVFCSVSMETGTYSYDGDDVAIIKEFLKDHPLKYYVVREDTIKAITNPVGKENLYISEADPK